MTKMFHIVGDDISDGYNTFSEIYNHRMLLYINLCLMNAKNCFWKPDYEDHFLLYFESTVGQISYYLEDKYLPLIQDRISRDDYHQWDGHTSNDVLGRLLSLAASHG